MKFIQKGISAQGKQVYHLALGVKDIELLIGTARAAAENMPRLPRTKDDRRRLTSMVKALGEGLDMARSINDEGKRLPVKERRNG